MTARTSATAEELTPTEFAVLALLTEGELSGYDLKKRIDRSVGYFWGPAKSQIYAVLPRLVAAGLARSRKVAQSQRPDKQVYRLTRRGAQAVERWLEEAPIGPDPNRNLLLLKLFFGGRASPEILARQVRERREEAEQLRATLKQIEAEKAGEEDFFPRLTRRYGLRYADAIIRWAAEAERELDVLARSEAA